MAHRLQKTGQVVQRPLVSHGDMLVRLHSVLYEEVAVSVKTVYQQERLE